MKTRPDRRLTVLYILALGTIAALAIVAQIIIQQGLARQADDGRVINIAGRQRMLSQRIAKASLALHDPGTAAARAQYLNELEESLSLWEASHEGLQRGDPAQGLPGTNSPAVTALFDAMEPDYVQMRDAARRLLANVRRAPTDAAALDNDLALILATEPAFLRQMNTIVFQYDEEARQHVDWVRQIELTLLGVTLTVLLLEGLFVFRPAAGAIRRALRDAEASRDRATAESARLHEALVQVEAARDQERIIAAQQNVIEQLSTPLVPLADGILLVPLVGAFDSARVATTVETTLRGIDQHNARIVILDITGVDVMDTVTARALLQLAQAAGLLGCTLLLTGVSPANADTLVRLDIDLRTIETYGTLRDGVRRALRRPRT